MRKYLSIIIPRYNESELEVFPLLASISGQVGIDFADIEVIIANDGGNSGELEKDFLALFGFDIKQIFLSENCGPGAARQAGLDAAKGEYVMFCDADDTLHNVGVLGAMMQEAEKTVVDILTTEWLEELKDENGVYYVRHAIENTWMHGKLFRRQFLKQNGVRFHDKLRVHEDSYFLAIATALTERRNHMPITSYVWKFKPDSITRRNGGVYTYDSIPIFIEACTMAFAEIEKLRPEEMEYKIVQFAMYNYFCFHQAGWQSPENSKYLAAAETAFVKHIAPFWHFFQNASQEIFATVYNEERAKSFVGGVETETLDMWLDRIGMRNSQSQVEMSA